MEKTHKDTVKPATAGQQVLPVTLSTAVQCLQAKPLLKLSANKHKYNKHSSCDNGCVNSY